MIKAKKSLGQNFLIDKNVIDKITSLIEIKNKSVLEVGPGTGSLTLSILNKKPKKLLVVEKDNNLFIDTSNNIGSIQLKLQEKEDRWLQLMELDEN